MVLFNYSTKEITAKIVYYGPGLCGKTTNLQFVYEALPSNNKSKMLSLATKADRTLFFDFLPLDLGKIRGMRTRVQLYTVPGQVYYNSTRQLVLKGADGVVFVADSQDNVMDANLESWRNLKENLRKQGVDYRKLPTVIQYNKRDLPNALPIEELEAQVNELDLPYHESVATTGMGVEDTLKGITRLVLKDLMERYGLSGDVSEDEIGLGPRPTGLLPENDDEVWADDRSQEPEGDVAEVPFLMSEPAGIAPPPHEAGPEVEVTELDEASSANFVEGQVEVVAEPTVAADSDDIEFDTVADDAPVDPKPLSADSLVVAVQSAVTPTAPEPTAPSPPADPTPPPAEPPPAAVPSSGETVEPPPTGRPSFSSPVPPPPRPSLVGTAADPGTLIKEISLPLNLTIDEVAGKRRIVLKIAVEVNILR